jgi:flagellar L-ring protein precursor FlgH
MKMYMIMVAMSGLLIGCDTLNPPEPGNDPSFAPTYPVGRDPKSSNYVNGAIYNTETALPLFETPRARHVGDILTIKLMERTDAQKRARSRSNKNDKYQGQNDTFLGRPISLGSGYSMDFALQNKREFNGEGESVQNNQLNGSISVTVAEVLTNGNMVVQGEKWIQINQGNEYVRLSGIVRPQDIQPDNTITSDKIANAKISYSGTGQVANANVQGWFSKFIWSALWPW